MNRVRPALVLVLALSAPMFSARAEQEVTLQSGATLIGDVTFDGDALVVDIDGAKQRVPLTDVESVTPTGFGPEREARRLLLAALEARQLGGPPREALGLLAEAARLDPDNPQVAFWHASTLVDAGLGKAASRAYQSHAEAIVDAYPDAARKLAERIHMRTLLEMLPSNMVERIDALNAAAAVQPANAAVRPMAVAFRVLDQFKDPVEQTASRIHATGSDETLEPYADGYYLYTFSRRRDESDQPCRLNVAQYGFKSTEHQFRASSTQVAIAGEFTAHRYGEDEKRPFRAQVVDRDGKPLAEVSVVLRPSIPNRGGRQPEPLSALTADDGKVSLALFPGAYSYSIAHDGYSGAQQSVEIAGEGAQEAERRIVLHRTIDAQLRVAWIASPFQPGGPPVSALASGEEIVEINAAARPSSPHTPQSPARLMQDEDRLVVQLETFPYYAPGAAGMVSPWLKKQTPADAGDDDAARFAAIDLKNAAEQDEGFESVPFQGAGPGYGQPTMRIPAKPGDLFIGQFIGRDSRTGQPQNFTFKAHVIQPQRDASTSE